MTPYPTARLAFFSQEGDDLYLTLQFDRDASRVIEITEIGMQVERVRITRGQLANIVKDGVRVLG